MPFDSPDISLSDLLADIDKGVLQLPDFQRDWKWDVDRIASLIASVSLGHPVGVVMLLEVGGEGVRFKPRRLAGVDAAAAQDPEQLVLDGQQRLTSLYQALRSRRVVDTFDTRGKQLARWFYIDMAVALDPDGDREEAIVPVPEDRVIRTNFGKDIAANYSSQVEEVAAECFPLDKVFDNAATFGWGLEYVRRSSLGEAEAFARWNAFYEGVLNNFVQYTVPVIALKKSTPKEAVCTVFEKVNTGGVPLNVFELLTATFASDDFRLNDDWEARRKRLKQQPSLRGLESTDFLQAVSLVVTARKRQQALDQGRPTPAVSCRRKDILRLSLADYEASVEQVTQGFEWAARFLAGQKIFRSADIPYRSQLVPLAALSALIGSDVDHYASSDKIIRWYWCGVLGELYGGAIETRFARDVEEVPAWLAGASEPRTVRDAAFETSRLYTMRTRNSAAYKGVYALLMRDGCKDWLKDLEIDLASFFGQSIDIHHVFPRKWCDDRGIDAGRRDCVVNKTPLSYDTNRSIGGRPPSQYLQTIETRTGKSDSALAALLRGHHIDVEHLTDDAFDAFFKSRTTALVTLIGEAMGKDVVDDDLVPEAVQAAFEPSILGEDQADEEPVFDHAAA